MSMSNLERINARKKELEEKKKKLSDLRKNKIDQKTQDSPEKISNLVEKQWLDTPTQINDNEKIVTQSPTKIKPVCKIMNDLMQINKQSGKCDIILYDIDVQTDDCNYLFENKKQAESASGESDTQNEYVLVKDETKPLLKHTETIESENINNSSIIKNVTEKKPELENEQKEEIMRTEDFKIFFDRASRKLEKLLEEKQIPIDPFHQVDDDDENLNDDREKIKLITPLITNETEGRVVTSMMMGNQNHDIILASQSNDFRDESANEEGLVLLWSKSLTSRYEIKLTAPSTVTHCCFHPFNEKLVIGGTYTGQIVMWDLRCNKSKPTSKTQRSEMGHSHPIVGLNVVGTKRTCNLISTSSEGRLCSWPLDKDFSLIIPNETHELKKEQILFPEKMKQDQNQPTMENVSPSCIGFAYNEVSNFIVGSEDGYLYKGNTHSKNHGPNTIKQNTIKHETQMEQIGSGMHHKALVSSLSWHPNNIANTGYGADPTQLLLSSSFDWTIKLWNPKLSHESILTYDANEQIYDVQWCPSQACTFAAVDGEGNLMIYDVGSNEEDHIYNYKVGNNALSKICWQNKGYDCDDYFLSKVISVADSQGQISILQVDEELTKPRSDDLIILERLIDTCNDK